MFLPIVGGCVVEEYCDRVLEHEWGRATSLRVSLDGVLRRPTTEEARELRTVIGRCKSIRRQFNLTNDLMDDEVWGTATVILLAVELDDVSLLDQLVSEGHSYTGLPNSLGVSTLYFSTYRLAENAFGWALENGIDPNLADTEGISPLMIAAMRPQDHLESIRQLIEAGADIDAVDASGRTALIYAVHSREYENATLLVEAGADLNLAMQSLLIDLKNARSETAEVRFQEYIDVFDEKFGTELVE